MSSVTWHIGKLELDLSANYNESESKFNGQTTDRNYTIVRFLLKRKLF
jgi:hypothetical protein